MIYKTNWLSGLLGPLLVCTSAAAVQSDMATSNQASLFIDNGAVFGMGYNAYGTIQPGSATQFLTPYFSGKLNAVSVAISGARSAVLYKGGTAEMAGPDANGVAMFTMLPASNITDVAISQRQVYYVANQVLYSWTGQAHVAPVQVASNVSQVASGDYHIVILFTNGTVGTLGESWTGLSNNHGQLGNGTTAEGTNTVYMVPNVSAAAIAAGNSHTFLLQADGTVIGFGKNTQYELGLGASNAKNQVTPVKVPNLTGVKKISAGLGNALMALKLDGTITACGWHNYNSEVPYLQLSSKQCTALPISGVKDISTGTGRLLVDTGIYGQRQGWGGNHYGSLGTGNNTETHTIGAIYFQPVTAATVAAAVTAAPKQALVIAPKPRVIAPKPVVAAPKPVVAPVPAPAPKPVVAPAPAPKPVVAPAPVKCNNGFGNGDQCAPGNSLTNNNAENAQPGKTPGKT